MTWKIKIGNFLFKHRSFTPLPFIILVFVAFEPVHWGKNNLWVIIAGFCISALGELIRVLAVGYSFPGTSGRESYLRADNLNNSGIYSVVRNPLYIGNFFIFTGLAVVFANIFALLVFSFFLLSQYYFIIHAEENFLMEKYGEDYQKYILRVRRVLPVFHSYVANRNPFCGKKVLLKEKSSVLNFLIIFLAVIAYREFKFNGAVEHPIIFIISGATLVIFYLTIKWLRPKWEE